MRRLLGVPVFLLLLHGADRPGEELKVEVRSFSKRLTFTGELQASRSVLVGVPRATGQWSFRLSYLIPEGSEVQPGEVLARFDTSDLEIKRLDLAKKREEARFKVAQREAELEIQRQDLRMARATARKNLGVSELFARIDPSLIPRADYEKYEFDLAKARIDLAVAEERLQSLENTSEADLRVLQLEYEHAQIELQRLESELESLEVRSPVSGLVIYQENWQAGRKIQAGDSFYRGQPLVDVADLGQMKVMASVYPADFPHLRVGMPAEVILDAFPHRSYSGRIARVPEAAKPLRFQSQLNVFEVGVELLESSPVMKPGMTARVWVRTPPRQGLTVPRQALQLDEQGRTFVSLRQDPSLRIPVRVIEADTREVLLEGDLSDGVLLLSAHEQARQGGASRDIDWIPIKREDLVFTVSGSGMLQATRSLDVGPPVLADYSRLKIIRLVPEGTDVKEGDFLIAFDPSEIDKRLREEQANLQKAGEELEKTRSSLATQVKDLEMELEDARVQHQKAENKLLQAREFEALIEVQRAELEAELARDRLGMLERKIEFLEKQVALQLSVLEESEQFYRRRVESNQRAIGRLTLASPLEGTVVYIPNWNNEKKKVGDEVFVMERILSIPDLHSLVIRGQVSEVDAGKVRPGQKVLVTLDAVPDRNFTAQIIEVGTVFKQASFERPVKVLEIVVEVDEVDSRRMRPEMTGRLQIILEEFKNAIAVPLSVIRVEEGESYLWVKEKEKPVRRRVRLGRDNGIVAVVEEGLAEGDQVASRPPGG